MSTTNKKINIDVNTNSASVDQAVRSMENLIKTFKNLKDSNATLTIFKRKELDIIIKIADEEKKRLDKIKKLLDIKSVIDVLNKRESLLNKGEQKVLLDRVRQYEKIYENINKQTIVKKQLADIDKKMAEEEKKRLEETSVEKNVAFRNDPLKAMGDSLRKSFNLKEILKAKNVDYNEKYTAADDKIKIIQPRLQELWKRNEIKPLTNKEVKEYGDLTSELQNLEKVKSGIGKSQTIMNASMGATAMVFQGIANVAQVANKYFSQIVGFSLSVKDIFADIVAEMANMLNAKSGMATYDIGSSLVSNAQARNQMLSLGLTDSQNWALTNVGELMGLYNGDLYENLAFMNETQRTYFSSAMDKYGNWYEDLKSSGALESIQRMQLDFTMFKTEISANFLQWIANNKEKIMNALTVIITVMEWLMKALVEVLNYFGKSVNTNVSTMSDYNTTNNSYVAPINNININMSNTATGVLSSQENLEEFFKEQMEQMVQKTVNVIG